MKGNETKQEIIRIGTEMIGHSGFNSTGLEAILKKAKVPKGSFYYYFPSKDDFGLAVIDQVAAECEEKLDHYLLDKKFSPLDRIRNYLEGGIAAQESNQCRRGCLIGNMGQELASQSEKFRRRLDEIFLAWRDRFAVCFEEAKKKGDLNGDIDVRRISEFLLTGWEGAILRAKVMKSVRPMKEFIEILF